MDKKFITKSAEQTQKLGQELALRLRSGQDCRKPAVVVGLSGNLGGGKTTFLQGFAKGLGIKEKILSPTFVIMKHFKILPRIKSYKLKATSYSDFYHIDCYRLKDEKDILELGWKDIISNPKNIIAVEWPERIKKVLPKSTIFITFKFLNKSKRGVNFET